MTDSTKRRVIEPGWRINLNASKLYELIAQMSDMMISAGLASNGIATENASENSANINKDRQKILLEMVQDRVREYMKESCSVIAASIGLLFSLVPAIQHRTALGIETPSLEKLEELHAFNDTCVIVYDFIVNLLVGTDYISLPARGIGLVCPEHYILSTDLEKKFEDETAQAYMERTDGKIVCAVIAPEKVTVPLMLHIMHTLAITIICVKHIKEIILCMRSKTDLNNKTYCIWHDFIESHGPVIRKLTNAEMRHQLAIVENGEAGKKGKPDEAVKDSVKYAIRTDNVLAYKYYEAADRLIFSWIKSVTTESVHSYAYLFRAKTAVEELLKTKVSKHISDQLEFKKHLEEIKLKQRKEEAKEIEGCENNDNNNNTNKKNDE